VAIARWVAGLVACSRQGLEFSFIVVIVRVDSGIVDGSLVRWGVLAPSTVNCRGSVFQGELERLLGAIVGSWEAIAGDAVLFEETISVVSIVIVVC